MKEMVKNYKISFRWWRGDKKAIPPDHQELLKEEVWRRMMSVTSDGYTSGELEYNIDGIDYNGRWEIKEK